MERRKLNKEELRSERDIEEKKVDMRDKVLIIEKIERLKKRKRNDVMVRLSRWERKSVEDLRGKKIGSKELIRVVE